MKQRLAIAMTLIGDPDLLILDEPSNGIDPRGFEAIRSLLIRLNREQGKTIFISSHQLEELSKLATSYGFMKNGRIVEQLSRAELEDKSKRLSAAAHRRQQTGRPSVWKSCCISAITGS